MTKERKRTKSLKRKVGTKKELVTIVIFSEGGTEQDYIKGLKNLPGLSDKFHIELDPRIGVGPKQLVNMAKDRRSDREVDECWCIFDVEWSRVRPIHHTTLADAVSDATENEVPIVVSNPCFETWLIWHFQEGMKFEDNESAKKRSRALDGRPRDVNNLTDVIDKYMLRQSRIDACRRAKKADRHHESAATLLPHNNPSSTMYLLMSRLNHEEWFAGKTDHQ